MRAVTTPRTTILLTLGLVLGLLALSAPSGASAPAGPTTNFKGAFEFEGLASKKAGKGCEGQGAFGVMKKGAKVTLSERDAATGDFEVIGTAKLGRGKEVESLGEDVCRMTYTVKPKTAPAADSRLYLEVKRVTFNISFPAADVTDGDLGTWRCEFSDDTCAVLVGS